MQTGFLTHGDDETTANAAESPKCDTGEAHVPQDNSPLFAALAVAADAAHANVVTASAQPMTSLAPSDSSDSPHLLGAPLTSGGPPPLNKVRTSLFVMSSLFFII